MNDIDYVIPYVDCNSPRWIELNSIYTGSNFNDKEFKKRYSTNTLFKYIFRGLDKFFPFIRNVFLIVDDIDQIPMWLNRNNVRVIFHTDFIPKRFLPTFNSETIECFLWNIEDLSDRFIYANDDTYVTNHISPDIFFDGNNPRTSLVKKRYDKNNPEFYHKKFHYISNAATAEFGVSVDDGFYYAPFHIQNAMYKPDIRKTFFENSDFIFDSIRNVRGEHTLNQYYFIIKNQFRNNLKYINNSFSYKLISLENFKYDLLDFYNLPQLLCLNDNGSKNDEMVEPFLDILFPQKSRFEL